MKIALCSKGTFSLELGATKNRVEIAESLKKLGWETTLIDNKILGVPEGEKFNAEKYSIYLKDYLVNNAHLYDVVLYEYDTLPFDRKLFNKGTLFVARPAILAYHLLRIKFKYNLKTKLSNLYRKIKGAFNGQNTKGAAHYQQIDFCLANTDLIQVQNTKDRDLLLDKGFSTEKIIIIPNGITTERTQSFKGYDRSYNGPFTIAFVGTFDFRKGAMDFPNILTAIKSKFPDVHLNLLGTNGLFSGTEDVLEFFPEKDHKNITVVPKFKAADLPELLSKSHVGIFPSYLESFGFGALEMMCAGLPVVAYDSPGPVDFILNDLLIKTGDENALAQKTIELLSKPDWLKSQSEAARKRVIEHYCWDDIAAVADQQYKKYISQIRAVEAPQNI
jgi:glycosyltransferase involved in cell wall biosynthesis